MIKLLEPLPTDSKEATATFLWKSDESARFSCAVDSLKNQGNCGQGKSGRFTTGSLTDGPHVFYLLGEDDLGNAARVVIHRWNVGKSVNSMWITGTITAQQKVRQKVPGLYAVCR